MADEMVSRLVTWIVERHSIYILKEIDKSPKPWTKDKILQQYRFCNVYRELDKVTKWITANWRKPAAKDPDLWFAMCVARLVNWPPSLSDVGYPVPWNEANFIRIMGDLQKNNSKAWGGAYIVSTNGNVAKKHVYIAKNVLTPLWKARAYHRPKRDDTLEAFCKRLMTTNGMGSFMAGQVVADMKYVKPLKDAEDWFTFAVPGPGSKRGLNRVLGRSVDAPWSQGDWQVELRYLMDKVNPILHNEGTLPEALHAQDLQNCLCEFDKYERVRLNEGRPKARYPGV